MASCIVTGGAGFIGRNLVAALNERGEEDILIVDRLGEGEKWRNLNGLRFSDYMDKADFRARVAARGLEKAKAVFHLGACSATTETDADYLMDNNVLYTRDLCRQCLAEGVRFIYASSAATYGDGSAGYSDDPAGIEALRPLNMYGYSKHLFDLWAHRAGVLDRVAGLKYFNVYGPCEGHKGDMRSVVHKAREQIEETGRVGLFKSYRPEYEDGEQQRDFIYVGDAVAVTLFLYDNPAVNGLYNCGTGTPRTWLDLARAVFAALGREPQIDFIDMPASLQPKYQYYTCADMRRLPAAGYDRPFTSLEEGVRRVVEGGAAE